MPEDFGICRLGPGARTPRWVHKSSFYSISRSPDELSIVCEEKLVPKAVRCERGWRAIQVLGPLDLSLIGVLESVARPLTRARVSIFTISTFDTDYLLVRGKNLETATGALEAAGHRFDREPIRPAAPGSPSKPEKTPRDEDVAHLREDLPEISPPVPREQREGRDEDVAADAGGERAAWSPTAEDAPGTGVESAEDDAEREPATKKRRRRRGKRRKPPTEAREIHRRTESNELPAEDREDPEPDAEQPEHEPDAEQPEHEPDAEQPLEIRPDDASDRPEEPAARRRRSEDEGADSSGLYGGAIPQDAVELTDDTFESLELSPAILRTIQEVGFTHPTPVQAGVIPAALAGRDVIGLAETGSGKTAAFCLPLAERLTHGRGIRGLILCPTREIALQTKAFLEIFGRDHELETVAVIGGVKMGPQISGFRRRADILVATPGRLADHLRRRNLKLDELEELVLDEADHMLDLGFLPQIREILEQVPSEHRTMMFSATMPPPIENLTRLFMNDPVRIDVRPVGHVASGIEHRLYLVKEEDMKDCVTALIKEVDGSTLIFTRRKLYTEWLSRQLELDGFTSARIHSDRSQAQRVRALRGFREGKHRILVATDVAARGLDIPRIEHVINYSLPETPEDYIHRAGRTARGQAAGIVSSIGTWQDKITVRDLESRLGIKIPRCSVEGVEAWVELKQRKTVRRRRML